MYMAVPGGKSCISSSILFWFECVGACAALQLNNVHMHINRSGLEIHNGCSIA